MNNRKKKVFSMEITQEYQQIVLTQQQAETVIWMVFRPGWHTSFR